MKVIDFGTREKKDKEDSVEHALNIINKHDSFLLVAYNESDDDYTSFFCNLTPEQVVFISLLISKMALYEKCEGRHE